MMLVMSGLVWLMGGFFMSFMVGFFVVSVSVFNVFIISFIYNNCIVVNGILLVEIVVMKLIVKCCNIYCELKLDEFLYVVVNMFFLF